MLDLMQWNSALYALSYPIQAVGTSNTVTLFTTLSRTQSTDGHACAANNLHTILDLS
jgi:hypothetical protein